jgi:hypothetical protein
MLRASSHPDLLDLLRKKYKPRKKATRTRRGFHLIGFWGTSMYIGSGGIGLTMLKGMLYLIRILIKYP